MEDPKRGKGSERWLVHPNVNGKKKGTSITCHGEGKDVKVGMMKAVLRRFEIDIDGFFKS
jgi:predicted RNA binding protein YcfA (HicA-like mRNA interferase family)